MHKLEKQILAKINAHLTKNETSSIPFGGINEAHIRDINEGQKGQTVKLNPLIYALEQKNGEGLDLKKEEMDYLINNSDLSFIDSFGETALTVAISYDFHNLTEKQYKKLINDCPQNKPRTEADSCDVLIALSAPNLKFTNEMWRELIRKTDRGHFNNRTFLLARIFLKAEKIGSGIIEADVLAEKMDRKKLSQYKFGREILYSIAKHNQIEVGIKIVEKMGVKNAKQYVGKFKKNNMFLANQQQEIFDRLDKIIDMANTKKKINQSLNKNSNKKTSGWKL